MPKLHWIDSFCEGPFSGNPAGVCLLEREAGLDWMKGLAAELKLSETAFVLRQGDSFSLRWFTPAGVEVKLCGHATLAAAEALFNEGLARETEAIRFDTLSGELRAWRRKADGLIELDFPERQVEAAAPPKGMLEALDLLKAVSVSREADDWLVECGSEAEVHALRPDFQALKAAGGRGICVSAASERDGADFVSRFFAPAVGIHEDPVTGSSHCYLGPFWAAKLGRTQLIGRQVSARGGLVHVALKNGRAFLAGEAKTVFKGQISD